MDTSSSALILEVDFHIQKKVKLASNNTNSELYFDVLERSVAFLVDDIFKDEFFATTPAALL